MRSPRPAGIPIPPSCLCLFPHCDDEFFVRSHLEDWCAHELQVKVAYLTCDRRAPDRRKAESRLFLRRLGAIEVDWSYEATGVKDADLVCGLASTLRYLRACLSSPVEVVVTPAYEGGHPDHDAAFWLGDRLRREGLAARHWYYHLYHGQGVPGRMFRVATPLSAEEPVSSLKTPLPNGVRDTLLAIWTFRSQVRAWVGLGPAYAASLLRSRGEHLYEAEHPKLGAPHSGTVLYERYRRACYEDVVKALREFHQGSAK